MSEDIEQLSQIIEAVLFSAGEPISIEQLIGLFEEDQKPTKQTVKQIIQQLTEDYDKRGIELKEMVGGFQFQVRVELSPWIQRLWLKRPPKYSRALLEVLAIIAYRQPITRGEIEEIRGVNVSTSMIKTLTDHHWIHVVGHKNVPGKPALYGTTKHFLNHFGLKNLEELPPLAETRAKGAGEDVDIIQTDISDS